MTPARAPTVGPLVTGGGGPPRRVITGSLIENWPLLKVQPDYIDTLRAATKDNIAKQQAWIDGLWTAPPNMFFGDVDWNAVTVPKFEPPNPGRIRIGYDHGLSAPSAAVFCYESKGEDIEFPDGSRKATLRGDVFIVDEFVAQSKPGVGPKPPMYPADIATKLHTVVERRGWNQRLLIVSGNIADTAIFSPGQNDNRASVADDFERAKIVFEPADKARVLGWAEMLKRLTAAKAPEGGIREEPGLFTCENCQHLLGSLLWKWLVHLALAAPAKSSEDFEERAASGEFDQAQVTFRDADGKPAALRPDIEELRRQSAELKAKGPVHKQPSHKVAIFPADEPEVKSKAVTAEDEEPERPTLADNPRAYYVPKSEPLRRPPPYTGGDMGSGREGIGRGPDPERDGRHQGFRMTKV